MSGQSDHNREYGEVMLFSVNKTSGHYMGVSGLGWRTGSLEEQLKS